MADNGQSTKNGLKRVCRFNRAVVNSIFEFSVKGRVGAFESVGESWKMLDNIGEHWRTSKSIGESRIALSKVKTKFIILSFSLSTWSKGEMIGR